MLLLALTYDLNLTNIISGIILLAVGRILYAQSKHNRRQKLIDIKLESIVYAIEISLNGQGEEWRNNYNKRKQELMEEHKFTDEAVK